MSTSFRPGVYRHFRGDLVRTLTLAEDFSERDLGDVDGVHRPTEEIYVVYIVLSGASAGSIRICALEQWNETVDGEKRFTFVYEP